MLIDSLPLKGLFYLQQLFYGQQLKDIVDPRYDVEASFVSSTSEPNSPRSSSISVASESELVPTKFIMFVNLIQKMLYYAKSDKNFEDDIVQIERGDSTPKNRMS